MVYNRGSVMGKGHHSCGVAACHNTSVNARKKGLVIHFFRFPQDADVKKEWIAKCRRSDKKFNPDNARICSDHFTLDDYEDSFKARIMGKTPIKLKKNAVPSTLLHPLNSKKQPSTPFRQVHRKKFKETTSQLLVDESSKQDLMPIMEDTSTSSCLKSKIRLSSPNKKHTGDEKSLQQKIELITKGSKKFKLASKPNEIFKSSSSKNVTSLQSHDMQLERRVSQFFASKVQIVVAELL